MAKVKKEVNEVLEPIFLDKFLLHSGEDGAKEKSTNSSNIHRHHKDLSKVITMLKTRIEVLELELRMVMSRYPAEYWLKVHKWILKQVEQEERIKEEQKKLEVLKSERVKIHYH